MKSSYIRSDTFISTKFMEKKFPLKNQVKIFKPFLELDFLFDFITSSHVIDKNFKVV